MSVFLCSRIDEKKIKSAIKKIGRKKVVVIIKLSGGYGKVVNGILRSYSKIGIVISSLPYNKKECDYDVYYTDISNVRLMSFFEALSFILPKFAELQADYDDLERRYLLPKK